MLNDLDTEIATRCSEITRGHPSWPCQRGCDHCCRHLSEPPQLRRAEWARIEGALTELDGDVRRKIEARLVEVVSQTRGPIVCPFLDLEAGACRVYEARPVACRTYGFYASRDGGRYCSTIEERLATSELVVLGNHDVVERQIDRRCGPPIPFAQWAG